MEPEQPSHSWNDAKNGIYFRWMPSPEKHSGIRTGGGGDEMVCFCHIPAWHIGLTGKEHQKHIIHNRTPFPISRFIWLAPIGAEEVRRPCDP